MDPGLYHHGIQTATLNYPRLIHPKNQNSALKNSVFVMEALKKAERVDAQPHICSPLSVVDSK